MTIRNWGLVGLLAATTACAPSENRFSPGQEIPEVMFRIEYSAPQVSENGPQLDSAALAKLADEMPLEAALAKATANVYVLDVSGSMDRIYRNVNGRPIKKIDAVRNFAFPSGARMYGCAGNTWQQNGTELSEVVSGGSTPFYECLHHAIEIADTNSAVTGLTDGEDDKLSESAVRGIISLAISKKVSVSIVPVGINDNTATRQLEAITSQTGGKIYSVP